MTAKAGIEGMTHGLARDLGAMASASIASFPAPCARRARSACGIRRKRKPSSWQGQCLQVRVEPDDVAALALFLASDNAAKCTGREYFVDADGTAHERHDAGKPAQGASARRTGSTIPSTST
jgi:enoyl-[acyl-carrier-protein] reductase (NADH)